MLQRKVIVIENKDKIKTLRKAVKEEKYKTSFNDYGNTKLNKNCLFIR